MPFLNRTGIRYGNLVALERVAGAGKVKWRCICDCGNETVVLGTNLTNGNTTSCGCSWVRAIKGDMVGRRFGSLTVVSEAQARKYKRGSAAMYLCECDCGGQITTFGMSLRNGDTISCGCAYKVAGARRVKPEEHKREVLRLNCRRRLAVKLGARKPFDDEFFRLLESEAYRLARLRTSLTDVPHQVDHIVPLRSPVVCGLHNEYNLRVITRSENASKSNRHWPHMPDSAGEFACS